MSTRTLNFTGRQRILRNDISLVLSAEHNGLRLRGAVRLGELASLGGHVVVELYRQSTRERMECGEASSEVTVNAAYPTLHAPHALLCDVKLVARSGDLQGQILAAARGIRPDLDEGLGGRQGLLPFEPRPLGQLLWRLELGDEQPVVLVNEAIEDWNGFVRNPLFTVTVMPAIAEGALRWTWERRQDFDSEPSDVLSGWAEVFRDLGIDVSARAEAGDTLDDLTADLSEAFGKRHRFLDKWNDIVTGGGEQ